MPQTATTTKAPVTVVLLTCMTFEADFLPELLISWSTCLMLHFKFYLMLPLSKFNFRWLKVRTNRPELTLMNWLGARLAKSETVHRMKLTIFQHNDNILNVYSDKQNNLTASYKATDGKTSSSSGRIGMVIVPPADLERWRQNWNSRDGGRNCFEQKYKWECMFRSMILRLLLSLRTIAQRHCSNCASTNVFHIVAPS